MSSAPLDMRRTSFILQYAKVLIIASSSFTCLKNFMKWTNNVRNGRPHRLSFMQGHGLYIGLSNVWSAANVIHIKITGRGNAAHLSLSSCPVIVICHSRRNNSNKGDYWKVTYPILSIYDIVKIKVNSYKRKCFVSLFRNKTLPSHINITIRTFTI